MKKLLLALSLLLITGCTSQINFPDETATTEAPNPTPVSEKNDEVQTGEVYYDSEETPIFAFHENTNTVELLYESPEYDALSLEEKWLFMYYLTASQSLVAGTGATVILTLNEHFLNFFESNGEIFGNIAKYGFSNVEDFKVTDILSSGVIDEEIGYMHNNEKYLELLEEAKSLVPSSN